MSAQEEFDVLKAYIKEHARSYKESGDKIIFSCLFHDDATPSASMKIGRSGRPIIYCSVCGKIYDKIRRDAGLWREPHNDTYSPFEKFLYFNKVREYAYVDFSTGVYLFTRFRMKDKKQQGFPVGCKDGSRVVRGINGVDTSRAVFCNGQLSRLKDAIAKGDLVAYTEGEKDCLGLWKAGLVSFTCGGVRTFKESLLPYLKGGRFVVFGDNDVVGKQDAERITGLLNTVGSATMVIPPDVPDHGDISDYLKSHSREELEQLIKQNTAVTEKPCTGLPIESVRQMLAYKIEHDRDGNEKSRKIMQTIRNHEIVLKNDARFAEKICFNEFSQQTFLMGDMPWETGSNYRAWTSYDDSALFSILQSDYGLTNRNDYFDAIKNVAMQNKFHPVRDLLDSLKWDNVEHIRNLLPEYLGAVDSEYNYQVMRLWMVGAVARICQPGCKFDYTIILQGRQGIGKSTFLQLLALNDQWFSDSLDSLDGDKAAQSLIGTWIVELAELKSLARTAGGVESVKRFLSATQDKYRVPYERRADVFLRQCVFAGTTNRSDFLQDETGNRRFLIVQTGATEPSKSLFEPSAMDDIRQAWAQAFHIWKAEHPKLVLSESCSEEAQQLQQEYLADDGKAGLIAEYLADKQRVCVLEIWQKALQENGRPQKWQSAEISSIVLGMAGWEKMKSPARFGEYGMQRGFQKKCQQAGACRQDFLQVSDEELSELPFE